MTRAKELTALGDLLKTLGQTATPEALCSIDHLVEEALEQHLLMCDFVGELLMCCNLKEAQESTDDFIFRLSFLQNHQASIGHNLNQLSNATSSASVILKGQENNRHDAIQGVAS